MTNRNSFVLGAAAILVFGLVLAANAVMNGSQGNNGMMPYDKGYKHLENKTGNKTGNCSGNMSDKYRNLTAELGLPANATPIEIRNAIFDKRFDEKIAGLNLTLDSSIGDLKDALKLVMQNNSSNGKGLGWRMGDLLIAGKNFKEKVKEKADNHQKMGNNKNKED